MARQQKHNCAGCGLPAEKSYRAYCFACIKEKPQLAGIVYKPLQDRLRGRRLCSFPISAWTKLMLVVDIGILLCLECGQKFAAGVEVPMYKHRCYAHPLTRNNVCVVCKRSKYAYEFLVVPHRGYNVRAVICSGCCDKGSVTMVDQRSYMMRKRLAR